MLSSQAAMSQKPLCLDGRRQQRNVVEAPFYTESYYLCYKYMPEGNKSRC